MDDHYVVSPGGHRRYIGPRMAQIIDALLDLKDDVEKPRKGRVEITLDFSDGSVTPSVRKVGEARKMEP